MRPNRLATMRVLDSHESGIDSLRVLGLANWDCPDPLTQAVPNGSNVRSLVVRLAAELRPFLHLTAWADVDLEHSVRPGADKIPSSIHYHDRTFFKNPHLPASLLVGGGPDEVEPAAWAQLLNEGSAAVYFTTDLDLLCELPVAVDSLGDDDPKSLRTDGEWRARLVRHGLLWVEPADDLLSVMISAPRAESLRPVLAILEDMDRRIAASEWYRAHEDRMAWNDDLGYMAVTRKR